MIRWLLKRMNIWVLVGALAVAFAMVVVFAGLVLLLPIPSTVVAGPQSALTVIPAPTPTPTRPRPVETPTPTNAPSIDGISIGSYVQITGTEGEGLRLRSGAGTENPPRFLGMDAEVFRVKDGPKMADGFTWWFLEAPYDPGRSGWAASKYLQVVSPTLTP